jgi:hypothetical protein
MREMRIFARLYPPYGYDCLSAFRANIHSRCCEDEEVFFHVQQC